MKSGKKTGSPAISKLCKGLLKEIGENPNREGLKDTPDRFARAMKELTVGYSQSVDELVGDAIFTESYSNMVVVKDIEFYSLCEHHILPFFGRAHVAYIPDGKIIGLSKIPRIVNMFARRLQVQERMTVQIADALQDLLNPLGVACTIDAYHMCMMMRGVAVQEGTMVTSAMRGTFLNDPKTREEFLNLINNSRRH